MNQAMNIDFNSKQEFEQNMLRDTAAGFVKDQIPTDYTRRMMGSETGVEEQVWAQFAEMGWTGLLVPEQNGGMGMSLGDMAIVLQEMGSAAHLGPFFACAVSSVLVLRECDSGDLRDELLSGIAAGSLVISYAVEECAGYKWSDFATTARATEVGYEISGTKRFVPYANLADSLVVAASLQGGVALFCIAPDQPGVAIEVLPTTSGARLCNVVFDGVSLGSHALLMGPEAAEAVVEKVFHLSALARCAEMVGGMISALKLTVDHVSIREQFGAPIGQFQAVQHRCADMLVHVDTAAMLVHDTIRSITEGDTSLAESAAICKVWSNDAYRQVMKSGHQMMGGTGYMEETDLQLFYRHARVAELSFGTSNFYRDVLAGELGI